MSKRPKFQMLWDGRECEWSLLAKWDRDLGTWVHHLVTDDRHLYAHAVPDADDIARADVEARAQP